MAFTNPDEDGRQDSSIISEQNAYSSRMASVGQLLCVTDHTLLRNHTDPALLLPRAFSLPAGCYIDQSHLQVLMIACGNEDRSESYVTSGDAEVHHLDG